MTVDAPVVDVLVVGAGPAGLSAAAALRQRGAGRVVVVEREAAAGGIPRHTEHTGFGLRDRRRLLRGPRYAQVLIDRAVTAGAELWTSTSALGWDDVLRLHVVGPGTPVGPVVARAVVLATGTRERPRSARLVPGDRPAGVLTTGALQQLTALAHAEIGRRAVIVGAEHVSFSAITTLTHAGCRPVALVTELPRPQTYRALWAATAGRHRVPVLTDTRVERIVGHTRVEAVELSGDRRLACDTVVFTGDWIPDNELARLAELPLACGSLAPRVDTSLRTARPGVFAVGNVLHGAETADVCALEGRAVASAVVAWLEDGAWPSPGVAVVAEPPIRWVHPPVVRPDDGPPPRNRYLLRVDRFVDGGRLAVTQADRVLWTGRAHGALVPHRSIALPGGWEATVHPAGPPVLVSVADLR